MLDTRTPAVVPFGYRRLYDAALTGIPFGIFKVGVGWTVGGSLGAAVMAWGLLDILLNGLAMAAPAHASYCLLSNLGRRLDRRRGGGHLWEQRLLAVDTFLSFALVAAMVWLHLIPGLPPALGRAWDLAVVANVMGVGLDRLYRAVT